MENRQYQNFKITKMDKGNGKKVIRLTNSQPYIINPIENKRNRNINSLLNAEEIALAMYKNGKNRKYQLIQISKLPELYSYINNKNIEFPERSIMSSLERHATPQNSHHLMQAGTAKPYLFDKVERGVWKLADQGIEYIEKYLLK